MKRRSFLRQMLGWAVVPAVLTRLPVSPKSEFVECKWPKGFGEPTKFDAPRYEDKFRVGGMGTLSSKAEGTTITYPSTSWGDWRVDPRKGGPRS